MIAKLFLAFLALAAAIHPVSAAPLDDAVAAAQSWLKQVDSQDYAASWTDAASLYQQGISQDAAAKRIKAVRDQMGPLQTRAYEAGTLTKTLPGMPDGDYAIVRFQSVFAKKKAAIESITLVLENGKWKVGGYFIK